MPLTHVVLISFKDGTSEEVQQQVFDMYQTIAAECGGKAAGILHFEVAHNLDLRKKIHLVETAIFADNDALQRFRVHTAHTAVTDILRECADWWVGDYMSDSLVFQDGPQIPVGHMSATIIVYKASDPSQIYVDLKDDGLPVSVFRRTLCPVGGNWIGETAVEDKGPRDTATREFFEELSFEKSMRDGIELSLLGLAEAAVMAPTEATGVTPTDEDYQMLRDLKKSIVAAAAPFGDYLVTISPETFKIGDPGSTRGELRYLTSYFVASLDDEMWRRLELLQRVFGNLSNESISTIISLDEIIAGDVKCAYGHEHGLIDFFKSHGFERAERMQVFPGTQAEFIGQPLNSYNEYERKFNVARKPR